MICKDCTCYYFDNILLDQKSYENILVYDISYKSLIGAKPLRIRFDVFRPDAINKMIYNRIRYLITLKSCITYVISHNYAKTKIESYDTLPNVTILINSIFNKDQKSYCFNIFL